MIERVQTPVSVTLVFDHQKRKVKPTQVLWDGKIYPLINVGLHHSYRQGRVLYHVFSVVSQSLFFKLVLNTKTLFWTLEEISDGLPN